MPGRGRRLLLLLTTAAQFAASTGLAAQRNTTEVILGGLGAGLQEWGRQQELRRRAEQRAASAAEEQRMLRMQLEAARAQDEAERRRVEAAFRLFWPKAAEVVRSIQHQFDMAGPDSEAFIREAGVILEDVFEVSPMASMEEIRGHLQPLTAEYARRDSSFAAFVEIWVSTMPKPKVPYDSAEIRVLIIALADAKSAYMTQRPSDESRGRLTAVMQGAVNALLVNRVSCYGEVARESFTPPVRIYELPKCIEDLKSPGLSSGFERIRSRP